MRANKAVSQGPGRLSPALIALRLPNQRLFSVPEPEIPRALCTYSADLDLSKNFCL